MTLLAQATADLSFLDMPAPAPGVAGLLGSRGFLIVVLLTVGVAIAAASFASLLERDRRRHGPALRGLARPAGLDAAHRRVVERLALRAGVACPAALLLSRGCFDAAIARGGANRVDSRRLGEVREAVFGASGEAADAPPSAVLTEGAAA